MGTNYYLVKQIGEVCPHCGRGESSERLHIGKSSAGWCFGLHVRPEENIRSLEDWKKLFPSGKIVDEYGAELSAATMIGEITDRTWPKKREDGPPWSYKSWQEFDRDNHSIAGPNGLSRHNYVGNLHSHGDGTWDCLTGDFS